MTTPTSPTTSGELRTCLKQLMITKNVRGVDMGVGFLGDAAVDEILKLVEVYTAQQRKQLLDEVLAAGPKDMVDVKGESDADYFYGYGNNQANKCWREAIERLRGK